MFRRSPFHSLHTHTPLYNCIQSGKCLDALGFDIEFGGDAAAVDLDKLHH